jgi:transposase-like protein
MSEDITQTLLSLNTKLKNRSFEKSNRKKVVFRIWTKKKNLMEFESEASTLNFFNKKWPRNKCPYCESIYGRKNLKKQDSKSWVFECPGCKSTLTVLNE